MIGRTRRRVAVLLVAATAATVAVIHFVPIVSDFTVPIVGSVIGVGWAAPRPSSGSRPDRRTWNGRHGIRGPAARSVRGTAAAGPKTMPCSPLATGWPQSDPGPAGRAAHQGPRDPRTVPDPAGTQNDRP